MGRQLVIYLMLAHLRTRTLPDMSIGVFTSILFTITLNWAIGNNYQTGT